MKVVFTLLVLISFTCSVTHGQVKRVKDSFLTHQQIRIDETINIQEIKKGVESSELNENSHRTLTFNLVDSPEATTTYTVNGKLSKGHKSIERLLAQEKGTLRNIRINKLHESVRTIVIIRCEKH